MCGLVYFAYRVLRSNVLKVVLWQPIAGRVAYSFACPFGPFPRPVSRLNSAVLFPSLPLSTRRHLHGTNSCCSFPHLLKMSALSFSSVRTCRG